MKTDLAKPYILTEEAQATIIQLLAEGNYLTTACARAGLDSDSFYHWRKRFEEGDPVAQKYAYFFGACKKASSQAEAVALSEIRKGDVGWQGNAWFLERRFPRRWGKQDREPVPGPPKPLEEMTDEEFEHYSSQVEARNRRRNRR